MGIIVKPYTRSHVRASFRKARGESSLKLIASGFIKQLSLAPSEWARGKNASRGVVLMPVSLDSLIFVTAPQHVSAGLDIISQAPRKFNREDSRNISREPKAGKFPDHATAL